MSKFYSKEKAQKAKENAIKANQEIKENFEALIEKIMGNKDELKRYFDSNKIGHNYSLRNLYWIVKQHESRNLDFPLTKLASYTAWTSLRGRNGERVKVKPGAFKVFVYTPKTLWQKDSNGKLVTDGRGKAIPERDEDGKIKKVPYFNLGNTFDVHQTNAIEIGAYLRLDFLSPGESFDSHFVDELSSRIETALGYSISFKDDLQSDGLCRFDTKEIEIDSKLDINGRVSVLLHEAGHALLHTPERFNNIGESVVTYEEIHQADNLKSKEAEAESFSYIISKSIGIEQPSENYLSHYSSPEESVEYLMERLDLLTSTATKFAKEIKIQSLVEDFNYRNSYPLHSAISQNGDIPKSLDHENILKVDHEGNNLLAIAIQGKNLPAIKQIIAAEQNLITTGTLSQDTDLSGQKNHYDISAKDIFEKEKENFSVSFADLIKQGTLSAVSPSIPNNIESEAVVEIEMDEDLEGELF